MASSYFPEYLWQSEISSLSKVILILGKARRCKAPNLDCGGLSHLRDLIFHHKTLHKTWCISVLLVWSYQLPFAHGCRLVYHPNSSHGGMFKLNAKFDADLLLYSLSHLECNSYTVHVPIQWCLPPPMTSTVKSSLFMHAHSTPLLLAARLHGLMQTILIILTMARLFLDGPCKTFKCWEYLNIFLALLQL